MMRRQFVHFVRTSNTYFQSVNRSSTRFSLNGGVVLVNVSVVSALLVDCPPSRTKKRASGIPHWLHRVAIVVLVRHKSFTTGLKK
jgi:hypothetical protein